MVSTLTLINAQTDKDIGPLVDGATIDFAKTGSKLNVRADGSNLGSVKFTLDAVDVRTESSPPLALAGDVNGVDYLPWTPSMGEHILTVTPYSGAGGSGTTGTALTVHFTVVDSTPAVQLVQVNDGSLQRSMVDSLTVKFNEPVALDSGAFAVVGRDGAGAGTVVSWSNPEGDGQTWVLTFAGATVVAGSLGDGIYDLTIVASKVHSGSATGPTMAADYMSAFHRLYNDVDGDGDSDNADLFAMKSAYGTTTPDPMYKWYFDYNGDGNIDNADVFQVRSRRSITFVGY